MPRESNLELKVGIFVVVGLVALVAFIFSISDFSVFQKGTEYKVIFHYANGLKKGAPVRLAGVDAGHLRDLKVVYDAVAQRVRVEGDLWLSHGTEIPADSKVAINQLGLLGEKYVEIMPGPSLQPAVAGTTFFGEDPVSMESIMQTISGIAKRVDTTLIGVNEKILNDANALALAATLQNISAVTAALKNGDGTVGKLLTDKDVYQNLDEMTADLKVNPWKLFYRPKGSK